MPSSRPERSISSRAASARALGKLLEQGQSLSALVPEAQALVPARDQALVQELCFGACRWFHRYNALLRLLLKEPLKARDSDLLALLIIGLYQMDKLRIPDHALSDTVDAARQLGKPWATKLVNGVLRNFQRNRAALLEQVDALPAQAASHPGWLYKAISQQWPAQASQILAASNAHPPLVLRVAGPDRAHYQQRLQVLGIESAPGTVAADSLVLARPTEVTQLPGFSQGEVSVQDQATQLAASLLPLAPGQRVLDCCSAPGGKTLHLLQREPSLQLTALDADARRLERVKENLARAGVQARVLCGDASQPGQWWDGQAFDQILLDAPCSATGVIRRHPDIKLLRKPDDIAKLAQLQAQILDAVWPLLAAGGQLLYATCSIMPAENAEQMAQFFARHANAGEVPIAGPWGQACSNGRQLLPGPDDTDGFYYCLIKKLSD